MNVTWRQRKRKHANVRPFETLGDYARYCCPHGVAKGYFYQAEFQMGMGRTSDGTLVPRIFRLPTIYTCCLREPWLCIRWWEDVNFLLDEWSRPVTESGRGAPSNDPIWEAIRAELAAVVPWPPEAEQTYRAARAKGRQRGHDRILWASRSEEM